MPGPSRARLEKVVCRVLGCTDKEGNHRAMNRSSYREHLILKHPSENSNDPRGFCSKVQSKIEFSKSRKSGSNIQQKDQKKGQQEQENQMQEKENQEQEKKNEEQEKENRQQEKENQEQEKENQEQEKKSQEQEKETQEQEKENQKQEKENQEQEKKNQGQLELDSLVDCEVLQE